VCDESRKHGFGWEGRIGNNSPRPYRSERLLRGTLVYVDPQTMLRTTAYSAPVWAINGVRSGWVRPIEVSFSQLKEVVKFVLQDFQDGGQQMGLY